MAIALHPWTAALCNLWTVVSSISFFVIYLHGGVSPKYTQDLQDIGAHAGTAVMLIFSACILELGFLWTGLMFARSGHDELRHSMKSHRMLDSILTLSEYCLKLCTGLTIWYVGGPIHTDLWSWGGQRPVYFWRFAQWSIAVPLLIVITNRAFLAEFGSWVTFVRTGPAFVLLFWSVWLTWIMDVTNTYEYRWPAMFIATVAFVLPVMDQIYLCQQCRHVGLYKMKAGVVAYEIFTFVAYTGVFLAGRFDLVSLYAEQVIYAYCDSTVKVMEGALLALIRSCEDAEQIHRWYGEAVAYKKDFNSIINLAGVPVITFRPDCSVVRANEAACAILDAEGGSLEGRDFMEMLAASERQSFQDAATRVYRGETSHSEFLELNVTGGRERSLLLKLVPVKLQEESGGMGFVAIGQDLTELSEIKAVEEKKLKLMAVVSHELRSPLHGMIGLTTSLLNKVPEDLKRQLGMVRSCSSRLLDLVTNAMDLNELEGRKDSKTGSMQLEKVSMLAVAEEVVVMTRMAVDKAHKSLLKPGVELKNCMRDEGPVPLVMGNLYKLTQMVYNLMTNACKFTSSGCVSLSCKHLKEQRVLEFIVADTGCGIAEEALERIFKPFEQEQSSSGDSRNFQGMGLGLAVVMEITAMHSAQIRVESEPGKGSSFIVSFKCLDEFCPDIKAPLEPVKSEPEPKAKPKAKLTRRSRPLILSVDDCEVNQEIIKVALSEDHEVVCCMDGPSALDWMEKNRLAQSALPDVILLDIQMPGMTGFEVCKKIRQHYEESHTILPIMMLSANTKAGSKSYEHGSTDFMSKPFQKEVLRQRVQEVMRQDRSSSESMVSGEMPRQSTEDIAMEVMSARAAVLEAEKDELKAKLLILEKNRSEPKLVASLDEEQSELEFLHTQIVQRDVDVARLESELGACRASKQLLSRRLQMQNRLNRMLHDTLMEGNDSASTRD